MKAERFAPVRMRPIDPDRDGPALHDILGDEESCRYLLRPAFATVEETVQQLRRWSEGEAQRSWVTLDDDDRATGRVSLYREKAGVWDAACMIAPRARGHGLARRALAQAIETVFSLEDVHRISADIDPDNQASIHTFESLGFRLEGRLRAVWRTHIGIRDSLMYGLLVSDPRPWRDTLT